MSSSVSSTSSNRITGLATGLDVDTLVKQLMQAEKAPLNKLVQKKQTLEWTRDAYRDITNSLRSFQDTFFNLTNSATNMVSASGYNKLTTTSSDSSLVTAIATADAKAGTHTVKVNQVATAATATGSAVTASLTATGAASLDYTGGNNKISITVDGVTKTISLATDAAYADYDDLVNNTTDGLQKLVDDAFGSDKIDVTIDGSGVLSFSSVSGTNKITLNSASSNDALSALNFTSGASNRISTTDTLATLATKLKTNLTFDNDQVKFTINGEQFTFSKDTALKDMMKEVNNSDAGVTLSYNEINDNFTITSKQKGAGNNIIISNEAGNLFQTDSSNSALGIATGSVGNGVDAIFELDGAQNITRSDNTITVDGVKYTFNDTTDGESVTINIIQDVDSTYNNIKNFVDQYNTLIDTINSKLSEEKYTDYKPLTDDQRDAMSEDEISKWEAKAKSGILRNDSILQKIVSDMRKALADTVSGISGSLSEIGITTGSYDEKGKLYIDETKLKEAISSNPQQVQDLFAKTSSISYSPDLSSSDRSQRYKEEGIAQRLYDIIRDNIRTTRDKNGYKGTLLEKAGLVGDTSEYHNLLYDQLDETETKITEMNNKLTDKEQAYYNKFSALETAIGKLNQQSSWITQFTSGS